MALTTNGPSARGAQVLATTAPVVAALADHDARVVGAWPLGLERAGSDVDVLCHVVDLEGFPDLVRRRCDVPTASSHLRPGDGWQPPAVVVRFDLAGVPVEVFGQDVAVAQQRGHRHLVVERRLLAAGGERLGTAVREHRARHGGSLEPAFATVLGLEGDPFEAVLALEPLDDAALARLVAGLVQSRWA